MMSLLLTASLSFAQEDVMEPLKKAERERLERERMEMIVGDSFGFFTNDFSGAKSRFKSSYLSWGESGIKTNCVRLVEAHALRMTVISEQIPSIGTPEIKDIKTWLMSNCMKISELASEDEKAMMAVAAFQGMNVDNIKPERINPQLVFEGFVRANSLLIEDKVFMSLPFVALGYYTRHENEVFLKTLEYINNTPKEQIAKDIKVVVGELDKVESFYMSQ
jgi:hypothetical protein